MKHLKSYPKVNGQKYYVSTANTADAGLETMVFKCDENGEVSEWNDLYCERYENDHEAFRGHNRIAKNLEEYLPDEEDVEEDFDPNETVTITRSKLAEASAKAWVRWAAEGEEGEKAERILRSLIDGATINSLMTEYLFDDKGDE